MKTLFLELTNLNNRSYIHGTSIVKGVLAALTSNYTVSNFEIRLRKKLIVQPVMAVTNMPVLSDDAIATGKFHFGSLIRYFNLYPTPVTRVPVLTIDEHSLESRVKSESGWWEMPLLPGDDIHVCYNSVSRLSNQLLFSYIPGIEMVTSKQTWFVGCKFPSLDFLSSTIGTLGVSAQHQMLTPICMNRFLLFNGEVVGERTCIYA